MEKFSVWKRKGARVSSFQVCFTFVRVRPVPESDRVCPDSVISEDAVVGAYASCLRLREVL